MSCSKIYRRAVNSHWLMGRRMRRRNLAEYEGHLKIDAQLLKELIALANEMLGRVKALGSIQVKSGA